jgi:heme-degrading monooxygenase HmoA
MILELATVDIRKGTNTGFESNLEKAQHIICKAKGYLSHEFHRCIEQDNRYIFLIRWETFEDHMLGFRGSSLFTSWREYIGPFFESAPMVQHFDLKFSG